MDKNSEETQSLWKQATKNFPEPKMKAWLEEDIQHFIDALDYICNSNPNETLHWTSVYQSEICPIKFPDDEEMRNALWELSTIPERKIMPQKKISNQKPNHEIIFRVSFESLYHPEKETAWELLIMRDGRYHFSTTKGLKNDKTDYVTAWSDGRYYLAKLNRKYFPQFAAAAEKLFQQKLKLHKKPCVVGWKDGYKEHWEAFKTQIVLYQATIWRIDHGEEAWPGLEPFDMAIAVDASSYASLCELMYGDDYGEYLQHQNEAREILDRMQIKIAAAASGVVPKETFAEIFQQDYAKIAAVELPRKKGGYTAVYFDESGRLSRVECTDDVSKIVAKIKTNKKLKALNKFFYVRKKDEDEVLDMMVDFANVFFEGEEMERNLELAYKVLQPLADDLERPDALYFMGLYHQEGHAPVQKDIKTAIKYYEKAIENGDVAYSANNLGTIYATGNGVRKDPKKAFEYYERAMNEGDIYATASVATMYEKGEGVERDRLKAYALYEEARCQAQIHKGISWEFQKAVEADAERLRKKLR